MTEEQIERTITRSMNGLDRQLMSGSLTQEAYDTEVRALDAWGEGQYLNLARTHFRRWNHA